MMGTPYTAGLHRLSEHTHAYLQPNGSWGLSNCGLIVGRDSAVLVDTQFDLPSTLRLREAIAPVLPALGVTTVVTTHANGDHCWGNQLFDDAEIIGSAACAHGMTEEATPEMIAALVKTAPGPLGDYMRRYFGRYDFTGITLTVPTRTFNGAAELMVGDLTVRLIEVGPAHTSGDVIVHVPEEDVLYAGDILFVGDHPIMWAGPVANWIRACDLIVQTRAQRIVPGHGPVTDRAGVVGIRDYLEYVAEAATSRYQAGMPYQQAALDIPMGPYAQWGHRERLVITVAGVYRELGLDEPVDILTVMTRTAEAWARLDTSTR